MESGHHRERFQMSVVCCKEFLWRVLVGLFLCALSQCYRSQTPVAHSTLQKQTGQRYDSLQVMFDFSYLLIDDLLVKAMSI